MSWFAVVGLTVSKSVDELYQLFRHLFVAMVIKGDVGYRRRLFPAQRVRQRSKYNKTFRNVRKR